MRTMLSRLAALLALLIFTMPHAAAAQEPIGAGGPLNSPATLLAETRVPAAGETVTLAFRFRPKPGWHGYWENPGDAGAGLQLDWTLPPGVTVGKPRFPVPERLVIAGLMNYVYEGEHAVLVPITVAADAVAGTALPISVRGEWLACTDEICVPEGAILSIALTVGDGAIAPLDQAMFDRWRGALPMPLSGQGSFAINADTVRIAIPFPAGADIGEAYFYPLTRGVIDYAAPQTILRRDDMLIVETRSTGPADRIEGVLQTAPHRGLLLTAGPGEVAAGGTPLDGSTGVRFGVRDAAPGGVAFVLLALGGALLGGLLLNIMPCVFPILSLKALSLARAGGNEAEVRREALAYTGGVILTCLALGGLLLALRAGGASIGWAFQLQDPRVIGLLLLLTAAIALNLAGLFELGNLGFGDRLARSGGTSGAFWTGALAAFIATPCTGPFMAAALGAALVLPAGLALAIFAGLGLGLALPFLLIGYVPAIRARLPRPGPWMERFRRLLSLPMFATALGLAWILGRQTGVNGMAVGLGAVLLLGVALWWFGRHQASGAPRRPLVQLVPAAAALALVLGLAPMMATGSTAVSAESGDILKSEPFSETRLAALRAEGRPVFVYFTADWCLTCKVNEKAVLERAETAAAFDAAGVTVLVGDWTSGDPVIGRFIERHNRSGIPLYLWYRPGGTDPDILPQILTVAGLAGLARSG